MLEIWYDYELGSLEIIDSYGEFSNVPLISTQGGINYNPALARRQLGFPLNLIEITLEQFQRLAEYRGMLILWII